MVALAQRSIWMSWLGSHQVDRSMLRMEALSSSSARCLYYSNKRYTSASVSQIITLWYLYCPSHIRARSPVRMAVDLSHGDASDDIATLETHVHRLTTAILSKLPRDNVRAVIFRTNRAAYIHSRIFHVKGVFPQIWAASDERTERQTSTQVLTRPFCVVMSRIEGFRARPRSTEAWP